MQLVFARGKSKVQHHSFKESSIALDGCDTPSNDPIENTEETPGLSNDGGNNSDESSVSEACSSSVVVELIKLLWRRTPKESAGTIRQTVYLDLRPPLSVHCTVNEPEN